MRMIGTPFVDALIEYDQIAKHDDPDVVKGIRDIERLSLVEPMPRNCDPIGHRRSICIYCVWGRWRGRGKEAQIHPTHNDRIIRKINML